MLGDMVSIIDINCVDVAILPAPTVAVQVTTVSPNGNNSGALFVIDAMPTISRI